MSKPKPTDTDMNVNCPGCGVGITTGNAGGYRTYCEDCVETAVSLQQAQAAIEAMLEECGLSRVIITAGGTHNRYSKIESNVPYTFGTLAELYEEKRPAPTMVQGRLIDV